MRPARLSDEVITERLATRGSWALADGKLHREFRFDSFEAAFRFMTAVAVEAEALDHHPEWFNVYSRVEVWLVTHDAGGLTEIDFDLADRMDCLSRG